MPDPKKYKKKQDFMNDCMHVMRREENRPQDQSVAICLSMWKNRNKDKNNNLRKRSSISDEIRKNACMIKRAAPHFVTTDEYPFVSVDLFFELMDSESVRKVITDLLKGETIRIPIDKYSQIYTSFSLSDIKGERYRVNVINTLKLYLSYTNRIKKNGKKFFYYDDVDKIYRRVKDKVEIGR